jgi:hypothetical protein
MSDQRPSPTHKPIEALLREYVNGFQLPRLKETAGGERWALKDRPPKVRKLDLWRNEISFSFSLVSGFFFLTSAPQEKERRGQEKHRMVF